MLDQREKEGKIESERREEKEKMEREEEWKAKTFICNAFQLVINGLKT